MADYSTLGLGSYNGPSLSKPNPRGRAQYLDPVASYSLTSYHTGYHKAGTAPTSAGKLADNPVALATGLLIKADDANTGQIYIRYDEDASTVTADAGNTTSGFRLNAGQGVLIDIDTPDKVWLIASGAGQDYVAIGVHG